MDIKPILLLFVGGLILTIGDIVMKKWIINNSMVLYFIGITIYIIGTNFLAISFKYTNIAVASSIFVIFNVVTLLTISWLYFKEPLSITQIIGIMLGLASVIILEL